MSGTIDVGHATFARDSVRERAARFLASRGGLACVVVLGVAFMAPSLRTGLVADDYMHAITLRGMKSVLPATGPLDIFRFANGDPATARGLMDVGEYAWTADPLTRFGFFRPLTALTHMLDYALWPNAPWMMHVQNLAWFALALAGAALLYRRLLGATWVAGLALLLLALDGTHGQVVGWIANRNAIIALALGLPVLWLHDRWRQGGWATGAWLAVPLLGASLLAGEPALAVTGYLGAYALCLDRAPWRSRIASLVPYGAVVVLWRAIYTHLGYGVSGSELYFDPGHQPLAYLAHLPRRLPFLLLSEFALPRADLAVTYEYIWAPLVWWMMAFAFVVLGVIGAAMVPLLRRDPVARFFGVGMVLSALPACAAYPQDRLLLFVSVGGMGLLAQFLASKGTGAARGVAIALATLHFVTLPPFSAMRALVNDLEESITVADATIPKTPDVRTKTVVLVNPPNDLFHGFVPAMRIARGDPLPLTMPVLADGMSQITIERLDERTLRIRPENGFLDHVGDRVLRGPERPFHAGAVVVLTAMTVTVTEVTADGRPAEAVFRFEKPLEDPSMEFLSWGEGGYAPWPLPAVGETVHPRKNDFRRFMLDIADRGHRG